MIELFNFLGNSRIKQEGEYIEIKDFSDNVLARAPDISSWNLTRLFTNSRKGKDSIKKVCLDDILKTYSEAANIYKHNTFYDDLIALSRGNPISKVMESKNMTINMLKNFNLILDENFSNKNFKGEIDRNNYNIKYNPVGIVGLISSSTTREVTPYAALNALSMRNSLIIKADSKEPFSAIEFAQNLTEAGIPENSISVITSNVLKRPDLGYKLKKHTDKLIIFGSDDNIRKISYYPLITLISPLELSNLPLPEDIIGFGTGRSRTVIDKDADITKAAKSTLESAVELPSLCLKTQFAIVDKSIYNHFVDECYKIGSNMKTGDLLDKKTEVGHVNPQYIPTANLMIKNAINLGGKFVLGDYIKKPATTPIIISDIPLECQIIKEECYAPVLGLIPSSDIYQTLDILINSVDHTVGKKSLKTSYFGNSKSNYLLLKNNSPTIELSKNKKTTDVNPLVPHQGIYLAKELSKPFIYEK